MSWIENNLIELVDIKTGKKDANQGDENGTFRFYTCAKDYSFIKEYAFDEEAILVSGNGAYVGYVHYFKGKFDAYQRTYILSNFKIDVYFLYHYLGEKLRFRIHREKQDGATPYITKGTLAKFKVKYPENPAEQTAIATILSKVDEAIEATQNSIKAAEKLKNSLMQNLLTGKLKPDGTLRTDDELQITKYGYAFKDWKYCKINDLIKEGYITKVQDGNHGESHPVAAEFVEAGIPFVMASDISKGYVDTDNCKKITKTRADKLRIGFSYKDDVLISHKASVGYTCIVEKAEPYIMLTPQVTLYRVDKQKLIPEYLLYFFQLYTFQIILEGNAKQSTRNYIGITNQKKMWIYLPDAIEEQKELVAPIIKVDKEVIGKQIKIKTLQRLKKSLMQNLLTGKVRVDLEAINKIISEQ
jgi:type I restriction enzyme, S subunit